MLIGIGCFIFCFNICDLFVDKKRHGDSHRLRMHQLGIKIEGWKPLTPVTIDKVGTYFRHTSAEIQHRVILLYFKNLFDKITHNVLVTTNHICSNCI